MLGHSFFFSKKMSSFSLNYDSKFKNKVGIILVSVGSCVFQFFQEVTN